MPPNDAKALRKLVAWLCGRVGPDDCRRSIGLESVDQLRDFADRQAKAGEKAVRDELSAQTPAEG